MATDPLDAIAAAREKAAAMPVADQVAAASEDLLGLRVALQRIADRATIMPESFVGKQVLAQFASSGLTMPTTLATMLKQTQAPG